MPSMETWRKESYPVMEALAISCATYRVHGFVNTKGHCIRDGVEIWPSKDIILNSLKDNFNKTEKPKKAFTIYENIPVMKAARADKKKAKAVYDKFLENLTMKKLVGDIRDFDLKILDVLKKDNISINADVGIIGWLPNSYDILMKKEGVQETLEDATEKGGTYLAGNIKDRVKILNAKVLDVKYLPNHGIYLVITLTPDNNTVKFFKRFNKKDHDNNINQDTIEDSIISFAGTITKKEVSSYTNCPETIVNRVHIWPKDKK